MTQTRPASGCDARHDRRAIRRHLPPTDPTGRPSPSASSVSPTRPTTASRRSPKLAAGQAPAEVRIPYFATSLPTLLLFDDDLSERAHEEALYLDGLAALGQGRTRAAATRFRKLLAVRPEHLEARLRLADISPAATRGLSERRPRRPRAIAR